MFTLTQENVIKESSICFIILLHISDDVSLQEANKNLLLMAYVRNPFARLASGYLEKFVHEWEWKKEKMEYKWLRDRILVNYRLSGDFEVPLPYPTPLGRFPMV